jgi:hypothetical protein
MQNILAVSVALLAVLAVACGAAATAMPTPSTTSAALSDADFEELQVELTVNRQLWDSKAIEKYQFEHRRICFCGWRFSGSVDIAVDGGLIAGVTFLEKESDVSDWEATGYDTIDGLFDIIQRAIDGRSETIVVKYDADLGYPSEVKLDRRAGAVDDDLEFTTGNLRTTAISDPVFIQLTDPLDEPQFYCLDVPGAGTAVRLDSALQVHTCKPLETAEDELFTLDHPAGGQIYMEAYDLCAEATGTTPGSTVILAACSESPNQRFIIENDLIQLDGAGQPNLCLSVDPGPGIPTGGPSHLRRDLTLENCDTTAPELSQWIFGMFDY